MQEQRRPLLEALSALAIIAAIGLLTVVGIGITVPQKPPATPTPTEMTFDLPTPIPTLAPTPSPAPITSTRIFLDIASAQKVVKFKITVPSALPSNANVQRIEVRDNNMFQSISIYYTRNSQNTLELFETESNNNTFFLRYFLTDPSQPDTTTVDGEPGLFEADQQGNLRLFWSRGEQVFGLRDDGWGLTRPDLLHLAESIK